MTWCCDHWAGLAVCALVRAKWFLCKSCQLEREAQTFVCLVAAGGTGFKGSQNPCRVHKVHGSTLEFRWVLHRGVTSSAASGSISSWSFSGLLFYRPNCASGTFSQCYFLPWTSCYYFVWLGSKVTWSNLFPSLMLTEKWRNDYKFYFFVCFRTLVREEICNFMFPRSSLQRQTYSKCCQMIIILVL